MRLTNKPLVIVAHDAGAANHILAWIEAGRLDVSNAEFLLDGPARKIFSKICKHPQESLRKKRYERVLIAGSGWSSDLEHEALKFAHKNNIYSISVVDHWVNYRERFTRGNETVLPSEIWVTDEFARDIAVTEFPTIKIALQSNDYAEMFVRHVSSLTPSQNNKKSSKNVLYILERVRGEWSLVKGSGEEECFKFFVESLEKTGLDLHLDITLRPHPSEALDKYDVWGRNTHKKGIDIKINNTDSLIKQVAQSDLVIGIESYALYLAMLSGKPVFSCLPNYAGVCRVPGANIHRISVSMEKLYEVLR